MPDDREATLTPLGMRVSDHLGADPAGVPLLREDLPPHRLVDADIALAALTARDDSAVLVGIGGGQERHHEDLPGLLMHRFAQFREGQVEYATAATGPATTRQTVSFGLRMLRFDGEGVVVLQRAANPMFGREAASLEILCTDEAAAAAFMAELQRLMIELSVVRGNVVGFAPSEYGHGIGRMTFLPRPDVAATDVVLPPGLLDEIRGHVIGIGAHAGRLRSLHQHLKRGVLALRPSGNREDTDGAAPAGCDARDDRRRAAGRKPRVCRRSGPSGARPLARDRRARGCRPDRDGAGHVRWPAAAAVRDPRRHGRGRGRHRHRLRPHDEPCGDPRARTGCATGAGGHGGGDPPSGCRSTACTVPDVRSIGAPERGCARCGRRCTQRA